jgi:2-polyprenyl-3-methyl-5-hydroxy-6-metoxy-1,4-benzoquinol methylase
MVLSPVIRDRLESLGWLNRGERPAIDRLAFPPRESARLAQFGLAWDDRAAHTRDAILSEILDGLARPTAVPRWIGETSDDLLVAEVDRYGLPLRTVLDRRTGLMRSDPYYDPSYLVRFYRDHYRELYRRATHDIGDFIAHQIQLGELIWRASREHLPEGAKVLDVGCGMGGVVAAFQLHGYRAMGCDFGPEYLEAGRKLGLNLIEGDADAAADDAPFDMIVLSQVLEHQVDPVAFLRSLRPLLTPNGLIFVMVPGIHVIRPRYRDDIAVYLQNAHVWHFTAATMTALLSLCGFTVLACDEIIECLARRTDEPPAIRIEEEAARAVESEIRRHQHWSRLRSFVMRGKASLRRRLT